MSPTFKIWLLTLVTSDINSQIKNDDTSKKIQDTKIALDNIINDIRNLKD